MTTRSRALGLTALGTIAALGLTGCATSPAEQASGSVTFDPEKSYEIVFESYNLGNATWDEPIRSLIAKFEEKYPNVSVTAQAAGDSTAAGGTAGSVQRQLLAGDPPDVVQLTFDTLGYAVSDLRAQSLEALVGDAAIEEHFGGDYPMHENVRGFGEVDGTIYGIPYVLSTPILYYNATAFEAAGIADADLSTWDGVRAAAEALTAASGRPSLSNSCLDPVGEWCYQSMVRSAGGQVLSDDRTEILAGEADAAAPIALMQELFQDGLLQNADFTGQYEAFAAGQTAMHINSASMQRAFQGGAAAGGWTLKAAPMPSFEGNDVVPVSSGSMLSIFSQDADTQAAAWEFVKFMTSPTAYETITPLGYLPLRTTMTEADAPLADWAAAQADLLTPNLEQLERIEPWVSYPSKNYVQISTIIMDAVEQVAYYGADATTTLADAQKRAQDLLK
ncbi:extracellular solute-binding protein [Salinibacterium sp. ZJ77]|uniref:extracellular solute-binding protein n=1 Tax=Salinibacterium sp. ZJ77 TaxID=2708337 RepID=UPI00141DA262|nr:extracellular solute-binding protein [Salinibacterium sp. ZJ77]